LKKSIGEFHVLSLASLEKTAQLKKELEDVMSLIKSLSSEALEQKSEVNPSQASKIS
jgi:hypothetical protein